LNVKTLVYSDNTEVALQLLGRALELGPAVAVAAGDQAAVLAEGGAKTFRIGEASLEHLRAAILEVARRESPALIMIASTRRGRELAPRVASVLGAGYCGDCFEVEPSEGSVKVKRLAYGGSTIATEAIKGTPAVVTVPPRSFKKCEERATPGEVIELNVTGVASTVRVLERRPKRTGDAGLENAKVIVSAGRGFKKREDLALLEELAGVLGAKVGCSRPISADLGWMDQWVGISGKKVAPRLYVACGISGTIQHAAGIRDSQTIVAVNSDEAAGIHELSDYSIVGDIYAVLPALTRALRERAR
jgi:electron transfer flavoprotein alpha subunit